MKTFSRAGLLGFTLATLTATSTLAQTAWDMPTPYGDGIWTLRSTS